MPPSLAREFFDRITRSENPLAAIRQLINQDEPVFESHWLDFKAEEQPKPGRTPDPKQQEQSNRREWSEYLSAFANTGGGVVLWGIDARKKEVDGRLLDFAGAEALMTDPIGLASSLNDWQGQATDPPLSGVEIRPFPVPDNPKKGFVLCYIPDGPFKPYQSLQTNNKQYYHRGGASNFVMPRPTLAAMFHPRMQARFQGIANLEYKLIPGSTPTRTQILCRMEMRNVGTATASEIVIRVTWKIPGVKTNMGAIGGLDELRLESEHILQHENPLHPRFQRPMFSATWEVPYPTIDRLLQRGHHPGDIPPFIRMDVYAKDIEPQTLEVPIDIAKLVENEKMTAEGMGDTFAAEDD